jgi:hypothetical protein
VKRQLRGKVRKNDLEGGVWELVTDAGEAYQLRGGDDGLRIDGQKVKVEGKIAKDAMGIGMTGPIFDVASWSKD